MTVGCQALEAETIRDLCTCQFGGYEMDKAFAFRGGRMIEVKACDLRNAQEAREISPFFDGHQLETGYVSACLRQGTIHISAHFRHLPDMKSVRQKLEEDIARRQISDGESQVHSHAKNLIASVLDQHVRSGTPLPWQLFDQSVSSFPLRGNLLSGITEVRTEFPIVTPCGLNFRVDVALLGKHLSLTKGPRSTEEPVLRAIVEIEHRHKFELLKCLAVQSMGVPLLAIGTDAAQRAISREWALATLSDLNAPERSDNIFLHLPFTLYPTFLDIPDVVRGERKHEFIIIVRDDLFRTMLSELDRLKRAMSLHDDEVKIIPFNINGNHDQAASKTLGLIGPLCGPKWETYNDCRFIRVQCDIPHNRPGNVYTFHLSMAALFARYPGLVGYKFCINADVRSREPLWMGKDLTGNVVKIAPRQLSVQIRKLDDLLHSRCPVISEDFDGVE
jgi:hypothetical protein